MAAGRSIYTILTIDRWESLNHMVYRWRSLRKVHGKLALRFLDWVIKQNDLKLSHLTHIYSLTVHVLVKARMYDPAKALLRELSQMGIGSSSVFGALMNTYPLCKSSPAVFDLLIRVQLKEKLSDALEIFHLMGFRGFNPSVCTCNMLMSMLIRGHRVDLVWPLFKEMLSRGIYPDSCTFNILINMLGAEGHLKKAHLLLKTMEECGFAPSVVTFNSLLNWYCKKRCYKAAYMLIDQMASRGIEADVVTYNMLIDDLCRNQSSSKGYMLLKRMRNRNICCNEISYNTVINGFVKEGKLEVAVRILDEMLNLKLLPNVITYNSLIDGYARIGNFQHALKFLNQMEHVGLQPNEVTYGAVLNGLNKHANFDLAQELIKRMKMNNVFMGTVAYTSLIEGFCKQGLPEESAKLLEKMNRDDVSPDIVTFSVLIDGFCRAGKFRKTKEVLCQIFRAGLQPNDVIYGSLIYNYCKFGDTPGALKFIRVMNSHGFFGNSFILNVLISSQCKQAKTEEFISSIRGMLPHANSVTFDCLLNTYASVGNGSKALIVYDAMIKFGHFPSYFTFGSMVKGLCRGGNLGEAKKILNNLQLIPNGIDAIMYNTLITETRKLGKVSEVVSLLEEMVQRNVLPDGYTCTSILAGLASKKKFISAVTYFERFTRQGDLKQNLVAYTIVIDALFKGGHPKAALYFCEIMKQKNIYPDTVSVNVMLNGLLRMGKSPVGDDILKAIDDGTFSPNLITFNTLLRWYVKKNDLLKVAHTYRIMRKSRFKPDKLTSHFLIIACGKVGMFDVSFKLLKAMIQQGVPIDHHTFSQFVSKLCETSTMQKVYNVVGVMDMIGINPDYSIYKSIISGLRRASAFKEAHHILRLMLESGFTPECGLYFSLIKNLCRVGDIKRAFKLKDEMGEYGICSLEFADSALVVALALCGKTEDAMFFVNIMLKQGRTPTASAFTTLMHMYCKNSNPLGALRLKSLMESHSVVLDTVAYNVLISGHLNYRDFDSAFNLYEEMKVKHLWPNSRTFIMMINAVLSGEMTSVIADALLRDLQERRIISERWKASTFRGLLMARTRLKSIQRQAYKR